MNLIAVIDTAKGHHNHGKLTIHTEPHLCTVAQGLDPTGTTSVALTTGLNGVVNGQWNKCPECDDIDKSCQRFVHGS